MKILGFDHVGICAKDPKAMADWYIEHLGFTLHSVGNGGNYFVESPDHVLIEIMVPMQGHDIDAAEPAIGWKHIALVPEDFDAAVQEMLDLGVTVTSGPNYREDGYCTFFFRDPDATSSTSPRARPWISRVSARPSRSRSYPPGCSPRPPGYTISARGHRQAGPHGQKIRRKPHKTPSSAARAPALLGCSAPSASARWAPRRARCSRSTSARWTS